MQVKEETKKLIHLTMARYTDSKCKLCRREQTKLYLKGERCTTEKCAFTKRQTIPGVHGTARLKRMTSYGMQFREKQKVKRTYGLLEKQFRRFFENALRAKGNTGVRFLQLLEMRLDNVVYRLGFVTSRNHARQLVTHGHVMVNGKKVSIPSYVTKVGDVIALKELTAKKDFLALFKESAKKVIQTPEWIEKGSGYEGRVAQEPTRAMIDEGIKEELIVELYSR